ncbi:16S rRNA (guanine(966)-N(2))-methyltransferase RsmD [Suttonella sp. R2A3]|uniref:16S rRNA (guanine(966)-N(2))-methyltransferase RsmD n=1 Tax=Suttonella sp. R2A3 TaxID=2908648 RepID=UPI001F39623E|nr:16S rRNA (guanine(966)-N(2))-methyltransferase RsmD [Suttonella sp. R2A3]UJF24753.1 16S rRNA (guanine(966)-N(2))-methyltransferase RsmD [Suttonella sp. R2A3]
MSKQRQHNHSVRIIAGKHRGRKIPVLDRPGLRPSPDRVRETTFNWLQFDLPGAHVLDAFAGSGAMGLESLSRGAASAVFVDKDAENITQINELLQSWHESHARAQTADVLTLAQPRTPYDVIFIDPPFADNLHQQALNQFSHPAWLKPHGMIYIELPERPDSLDLPQGFNWHRKQRAGSLYFGLIKRTDNADD